MNQARLLSVTLLGLMMSLATAHPIAQPASKTKIAAASGRSAYLDILERYRRGEYVEAIKELDALPDGHSANYVFAELERLTDRGADMRSRTAESEFRQERLADGWAVAFPVAATLHFEAGYFHMALGPSERMGKHLEIARLLVDYPRFDEVMQERPAVLKAFARLRRDIYFGILWTLQAHRPTDLLEQHLLRMRRPFAADAELALAQGSLEAWWGSTLVLRTTRAPTTAMVGNQWRRSEQERHFQTAADRFRLALKLDPKQAEARMRLGRILQQRGNLSEARAELEAVLAQPEAPLLIRYLALMFLVDVLEAEGRTDLAFERVRALVTRFPECQSGHLAMSRFYEARGDRAAALRALEPMWKEQSERKCADPWWLYDLGQHWRVPSLIEALRGAVKGTR